VRYLSADSGFLVVPAGYLDGDQAITPQANIFCEQRPYWFDEGKAATTFSTYLE